MSGTTTDQNDPALKNIDDKNMQEKYLVLSEEERAKGFVRPLRFIYIHNKWRVATKMGQALAETSARDPKFYGATYCVGSKCQNYFPVNQFVWEDGSMLGS